MGCLEVHLREPFHSYYISETARHHQKCYFCLICRLIERMTQTMLENGCNKGSGLILDWRSCTLNSLSQETKYDFFFFLPPWQNSYVTLTIYLFNGWVSDKSLPWIVHSGTNSVWLEIVSKFSSSKTRFYITLATWWESACSQIYI